MLNNQKTVEMAMYKCFDSLQQTLRLLSFHNRDSQHMFFEGCCALIVSLILHRRYTFREKVFFFMGQGFTLSRYSRKKYCTETLLVGATLEYVEESAHTIHLKYQERNTKSIFSKNRIRKRRAKTAWIF